MLIKIRAKVATEGKNRNKKGGGVMAKIEAINVVASRPSERRLQRRRSCQKMRVDYLEELYKRLHVQ